MGLIMIVFVIGVFAMWYALHVIIHSKKERKQKILYFLLGSTILYFSLSYCFFELLKFKL